MTMNASYKKLCDFMWFAFLPSLSKAEEKAAFYRNILTDDGVDCFDPASPASATSRAACWAISRNVTCFTGLM